MTSHYARCMVEASFNSVFKTLTERFGNVYSNQFTFNESHSIGVILGEQYFLRVNNDAAIAIVLQTADKDKTFLEIISCAGGAGLLEVSYAAHKAYVSDVKKYLEERFTVTVEEEVPYYSSRL